MKETDYQKQLREENERQSFKSQPQSLFDKLKRLLAKFKREDIKFFIKYVLFSILVFYAAKGLEATYFSSEPNTEFVGSKNSKVYHYAGCRWANNIKSENLIEFETWQEASRKNYRACETCKPPAFAKENLLDKRKMRF